MPFVQGVFWWMIMTNLVNLSAPRQINVTTSPFHKDWVGDVEFNQESTIKLGKLQETTRKSMVSMDMFHFDGGTLAPIHRVFPCSAGCWDSRLKSPVPEVQAAISGQWNKKTPLGLVNLGLVNQLRSGFKVGSPVGLYLVTDFWWFWLKFWL